MSNKRISHVYAYIQTLESTLIVTDQSKTLNMTVTAQSVKGW